MFKQILIAIDQLANTLCGGMADMPSDLHAVQWSGDTGHVERQGLPNQTIDSLGISRRGLADGIVRRR